MSEDTPQLPPPEGGQQEQQPQDGSQPTPAESALAESMMNPAQRASTEFRQQHGEELARIPEDLDYEMPYRNIAGLKRGAISGTFNGQRIRVEESSWSGDDAMRFYGDIEGVEMTPDEAKATWNKLFPLVELADSQEELKRNARKQVQKDAAAEAKRQEIANLQGLAEAQDKKFDRFKSVLDQSFERMAIKEDSLDYEFLKKSITKIATLAALGPSEGPYSADVILTGSAFSYQR